MGQLFAYDASAAAQLATDVNDEFFGVHILRVYELFTEFAHLHDEHRDGHDARDGVGRRDGIPHAENLWLDEMRQDEQQREQEKQLPRQREEDALAGVADALEEAGRDDLHSDDGEEQGDDAQALGRPLDEFGVGGESPGTGFGQELACDETCGRHDGAEDQGIAQDAEQAVVALGAEVVACDGLHALVESDDDHHDEEHKTVRYAVGADCHIAPVAHHALVDDDDDEAGAQVDEEGRQSDSERLGHDFAAQAVDAVLEADQFALAAEQAELPEQHERLRHDCGQGSSLYAPTEHVDEERGEHDVAEHRADGGEHGLLGAARRAQKGIQTQVEVCDDVAGKDDVHEVTGIGNGDGAGAEEVKYRVEQQFKQQTERKPHDDIHHHDIAQNVLGCLIILLPQFDRHERRGAHAHHGAERGCQRHERLCQCQPHDGLGAYALSDKDAVDDVVERRGRHRYDGGDGILHQQFADRFLA